MENENSVAEEIKTETPPAPVEEAKTEQPVEETAPIDYKAELERVSRQLKKAEHTIIKVKQSKKEAEEEIEEEQELPDVNEVVEQAVSKRLSKLQDDFVSDTIEETLERIADDADERKLIKFHYDNSIVKSGASRAAIKDDMRKAKLLANAPRYERENKEMAETVRAKATTVTTVASPSTTGSESVEDLRKHFTNRDWAFMQQRGWSKEQIKTAIPKKA